MIAGYRMFQSGRMEYLSKYLAIDGGVTLGQQISCVHDLRHKLSIGQQEDIQ